ncbi:unnamed protein product [Merluccius merluccius]
MRSERRNKQIHSYRLSTREFHTAVLLWFLQGGVGVLQLMEKDKVNFTLPSLRPTWSLDHTQAAAKEQQAAVTRPGSDPGGRMDTLGQKGDMLVLQAAVPLLTSAQCGGAVGSLPGGTVVSILGLR